MPSDNLNSDISKDSGIFIGKAASSWDVISDAESVLRNTIGKSRDIENRAIDEAKTAVEKAKESGYLKGHEEGFSKGYNEALKNEEDKKEPLIKNFNELEKIFSDSYLKKSQSNGTDYIEDAFELAKKIIYIELSKNDESYLNLYKKAAVHVNSAQKVTLKVGPRGYEAAQALRPKFEGSIDGLQDLEIVSVGSDDGFCLLETPLGNVNASVDAQLKRAKKIIVPQK